MDLFTPVAREHLLNGNVDLANDAVTAIRVGGANLVSRKWLYIYNASNVNIYIGSETTPGTVVTVLTLAKRGQKIPSGDAIWLPINENITVYGLSSLGGGKRLRIMELA